MSSTDRNQRQRVAIIGGGLVGTLQACFLARKGFQVDLYEMRHDIRKQEKVFGRSINLALSCRGREGLKAMGLEEEVIRNGIPMYGRMIHDIHGNRTAIYYGRKDQYIMSVDRRRLNEILLSAAEKYPNVQLHFDHKLLSCDFEKGESVFERSGGKAEVAEKADLIIGCDGAFSAVRALIMKSTRMYYSQEYIPEGYIELRIPPTDDNQFAMEKNYLHIWPRHTFMLIALPNAKDNSFVLTLFLSFDVFSSLTQEHSIIEFFQKYFPDALQLIGRESLVETFYRLKPLPVVSIKCRPYNLNDKAVILGDAAHAMVPFYGQGLNCGFEDLLVFDDLMNRYDDDLARVLTEFTNERSVDAHCINDLAMYNYHEMRSGVTSWTFLIRKKLDNFLFWLLPNTWIPLYTMVSFSRIRYHLCTARRKWQDKVLDRAVKIIGSGVFLAISAYVAFWLVQRNNGSGPLRAELLVEKLLAGFSAILKLLKLHT